MYVADGYVVYYYEMCLLWNDCGWVIYNSKNKFIDYCKGFSHLRYVNHHYSWYITVYFDGICVFNVSLILSAHVSFTLENALVTWDVGRERSNSYTDQHHKSKTTLYLLSVLERKQCLKTYQEYRSAWLYPSLLKPHVHSHLEKELCAYCAF